MFWDSFFTLYHNCHIVNGRRHSPSCSLSKDQSLMVDFVIWPFNFVDRTGEKQNHERRIKISIKVQSSRSKPSLSHCYGRRTRYEDPVFHSHIWRTTFTTINNSHGRLYVTIRPDGIIDLLISSSPNH